MNSKQRKTVTVAKPKKTSLATTLLKIKSGIRAGIIY